MSRTAITQPDFVGGIAKANSSFRLGIPRAYFYQALHPEIEAAMETAIAVLKEIIASQHDVGLMSSKDVYSS